MIEPKRLYVEVIPGFDSSRLEIPVSNGLHIVFGPNNVGKTRFLRALSNAQLITTLQPTDAPPSALSGRPELAPLWSAIAPLTIIWQRNNPTANPILQTARADLLQQFQYLPGAMRELMSRRPAIMVPTGRYGALTAQLGSTANINDPNTWAVFLENLRRSTQKADREKYKTIDDTFRSLTHGCRLEFLGSGTTTALHIVEQDSDPIAMTDCGDGLRDLLGIVMFAVHYPVEDLFIDDPGLRLHQNAQRDLLAYLESESQRRAIWMATHDGLFIGAPAIQSRYAVTRANKISRVRSVLDRDGMRDYFRELGWRPEDALLANTILFCEGESDRLVFQWILRRLAEQDPRLSGVVVAEIGGDGFLVGHKRDLFRTVDLVVKMAPHARFCALLDKGTRTDDQLRTLTSKLEQRAIRVSLLSRPELENYFLAPTFATALLTRMVETIREKRSTEIPSPNAVDVENTVNNASPTINGSAILEKYCEEFLKCHYDKILAAQIAIDLLSGSANEAAAIENDMQRALAGV
jgi:hypothetical protein